MTRQQLTAQITTYERGTPKEHWGYWNLLELLHVWMQYEEHLTPEAKENIRSAFRWALRRNGRIHKYWLGPDGGCINHGLSCMALGLVGGEQFDMPEATELGYRKLDRFAEGWSRMGSFSEYNSPTYSAVDVLALATVRQYSTSAEAAIKAKTLEERFWLEATGRFHVATGTLTGPFARSYYWDNIGGASDMHYVFHRVLGDSVPLWFDVTQRHYRMDHRLSWTGRAAVATYCCPKYVRRIMLQPPAQSMMRATTGPADSQVDLASYISPNISLGTAGQRFKGHGQRLDLIARWKRRHPVEEFRDIRAMFARQYGVGGDAYKSAGDHFHLQDDNRVLMMAMPNFEGQPPRDFTQQEMDATFHGFAMEIADAADYASFDAFCNAAAKWNVSSIVASGGPARRLGPVMARGR